MVACTFCEIIAGGREAYVLYEDDRTVAFLDANPAVEGHTLVAPKDHRAELLAAGETAATHADATEQPGAAASAVFETVETVSTRLREYLHPDGFSVFYTTETLVGTVTHAHVHLLPRTDGDDVSLALDRRPLDEERASALAAAVRNAG
ncbi:MAG: HIT family protein [Halolamina sp.]